jgi:N-acetylmuramoyl-L-alanine amidase
MNRYAARIGSALALALSLPLCAAVANAADNTYVYNGKRVVFQTLIDRPAGPAVSADDPGLRALVSAKGATLSWDSENQYVLITFPGPTVISFAIGDPHYLVGSVTETAAFAPFMRDNHPYVPLNDVLRALKLPPLSAVAPSAAPATSSPLPASELAPPPTPPPFATPMPSPQPVQVTAVDVQTQPGGVTIRIAVSGDGAYDWHRLRPPDNRWWIDVHGARLVIPPTDQPAGDPVTAVRTRQQSDAVRIALSLSDFDQVDVAPNDGGITVTVTNRKLADAPRSGAGTFGSNVTAQASPAVSPSSRYVPTNPNLIVIDPGHGGSDPGTVRGDAQEKALTFDMATRVRDILVARGWQVVMTRSSDRDVYAPNDSARDELQARDDVANSRGARLLISIHVNSYVNSGPHGVTTFYFKAGDFALAQAVNRRVISELDIKNNGVIKNKFYVINHASMPAALIETAFISNPDDLALLQSSSWRQKMAQAIADGIVDYTESN